MHVYLLLVHVGAALLSVLRRLDVMFRVIPEMKADKCEPPDKQTKKNKASPPPLPSF